jgi:hypothetical protein
MMMVQEPKKSSEEEEERAKNTVVSSTFLSLPFSEEGNGLRNKEGLSYKCILITINLLEECHSGAGVSYILHI